MYIKTRLTVFAFTLFASPMGFAQSNSGSNEILLQGGYVLSMDNDIGDLASGDVLIRDGQIIEVSASIEAPQAQIIDATGMVIMPGFVETHWHMWESSLRGMANDAAEYFYYSQVLAPHYTPEDFHAAVKYAALDAINAGITTVHNWAGVQTDFEIVQAEMRALVESGLRAKMGYLAVIREELTEEAELSRAINWINENGEQRLGLSLLLDGVQAEQMQTATELGRTLKLWPITDHSGGLGTPEVSGEEFIVTHGPGLTPEAIEIMVEKDIKVALSPLIDPMIGGGLPPVYALLAGGIPLENISFSVDVSAQTPVDPFASLRAMVNSARMQQVQANQVGVTAGTLIIPAPGTEWIFSYRDALLTGTYGGANVLGLADQTGSLTPGKRADVIMVNMNMINMLPLTDVDIPMQLVQHGLPANVDTVIIDGHIRKLNGELVDVDMQRVINEAAQSQAGIRSRAGE
tara:strand:+ start:17451 stop:18836 length:1386 start_codon:yes stop_codon:yes gene_type:complete